MRYNDFKHGGIEFSKRTYDDSKTLYSHQIMSNALDGLSSSLHQPKFIQASAQVSQDLVNRRPKTNDHLARG